MEKLNNSPSLALLLTILISFQFFSINAQINSPCTSSMMTNVVPCIGFVIGGGKNGASLTSACCDSIKKMMSNSMDCACLIVTGNVPLPNFVSQALAITLPQACGSSLPLQCESSGATLPPPGPILFAPPPPPAVISPHESPVASPDLSPIPSPPLSPTASKAIVLKSPPAPAEAVMESLTPSSAPVADVTPWIRPVFTTSTSTSGLNRAPSSFILFSFIAIMVLNYFQAAL